MRFHVIECEAVKINYSTCDIEELEFDRNISMPSWAFLPSFDLKSCCVRNSVHPVTFCSLYSFNLVPDFWTSPGYLL